MDAVRAYIHREPQPTISRIQQDSLKAKPLAGSFHCFQHIIPIPNGEVQRLLVKAIDDVKQVEYEKPILAPVTLEWVCQKAPSASRSKTGYSASQQRDILAEDTSRNLTIFHVHGGAFL